LKFKTFLFWILQIPFLLARKNTVGGQAIIEGVMMRGKSKVSWAVRKNAQEVIVEQYPFTSICKKHKFLAFPIFRGTVNLIESMLIGYKALSRSADIATEAEKEAQPDNKPAKSPNKALEKFYSALSFVIAFAISIGLFMYAPMWVISQFVPKESAILFNIYAGASRIVLLVGYMLGISLMKDIRRIFEYHGAEHKAIFAFEDEKELTLENMQTYSTLHPRCGTSFLILVGLVCVFLFTIIDALYITYVGPYPNVLARVFTHLLLVPLVSGISYEALKLSDRYQHIPLVRILIKPGLWLQNITTRQPDAQQLEVASLALRAAL
jgi:uncharacterized protein YqhQ